MSVYRPTAAERLALVENVEHLYETRRGWREFETRTGKKLPNLARTMYRYGRPDLGAPIMVYLKDGTS